MGTNPSGYVLTLEDKKKGAVAGVAARRKKKSMRDMAKALLGMKVGVLLSDEDNAKLVKYIKPDMSLNEAIVMSQAAKAVMNQDTQAAIFIRDTAGEKPNDKVELGGKITYVNALKKALGDEM